MERGFSWETYPKPIVGLSPMEGYSDSAFRQVCKKVNPSLILITEFTSADGLHHSPKKLREKLAFKPKEQPIIAQIFGNKPETFVSAAKVCEDMGFSGIDINMGCPSKRVVKSEHGVALRKNKNLAFKLIETLAKSTPLPISIKTRLGWSNAEDLIEFGQGAENAGAKMICVHARTYLEPYNVPAQFETVFELKKTLTIPVLGNGGILNYQDGLNKLNSLDGFLIGQASFGNPWVFSTDQKLPSLSEKISMMRTHALILQESKGESIAMREIRKHFSYYLKSLPHAKQFRSKLVQVHSMDEVNCILDEITLHCENANT